MLSDRLMDEEFVHVIVLSSLVLSFSSCPVDTANVRAANKNAADEILPAYGPLHLLSSHCQPNPYARPVCLIRYAYARNTLEVKISCRSKAAIIEGYSEAFPGKSPSSTLGSGVLVF